MLPSMYIDRYSTYLCFKIAWLKQKLSMVKVVVYIAIFNHLLC